MHWFGAIAAIYFGAFWCSARQTQNLFDLMHRKSEHSQGKIERFSKFVCNTVFGTKAALWTRQFFLQPCNRSI
jgi:hypothetical protein